MLFKVVSTVSGRVGLITSLFFLILFLFVDYNTNMEFM